MDLLRGTFSPFHLSTFKDPVNPVIRVLSLFRQHHVTTTPRHHEVLLSTYRSTYIYMRGMGLICISLSGVGLPAVILNPVRDDLRMMASNAVVAREGAMKDNAECTDIFTRLSRN